MDRMICVEINGVKRPLNYSTEVLFDVNDRFGSFDAAAELLDRDDREAFETVKWFAIHMANDAELCRREEGYDSMPMLEDADISPHMKVYEFLELKAAVVKAIELGYFREVENPEKEIDLGLQEIKSKKGKARH